MTAAQIRERLKVEDSRKGTPNWVYASHLDHLRTAEAWGIDPDVWETLSDESRGAMLAMYRTKRLMRAWEAFVFKPKD